MVRVVIHTNPQLENQREPARCMREGFARHGLNAEVTADKRRRGDIHIVQGPWYCYREWLGQPNVLYLDRCFFGNPARDVSLGWLNSDGSREFLNHGMAVAKGTLPELHPRTEKRRCAVIFADYGRDMTEVVKQARWDYDSVFFRPHPAQDQTTPVMTLRGELEGVWALADVAIGHSSTVLVEAEIRGKHVISSDPRHVCHGIEDRAQWLTDLSWAQWSFEELAAGTFWEHLCERAD